MIDTTEAVEAAAIAAWNARYEPGPAPRWETVPCHVQENVRELVRFAVIAAAPTIERLVREQAVRKLEAEAASLLHQSVTYYSGQARVLKRAAAMVKDAA